MKALTELLRKPLPLLLGLLVLAGCDETLGPDTAFDAQGMADAMESMVAATDGLDDAFLSLSLADGIMAAAPAALAPTSRTALPNAAAAREFASRLATEGFFPSNFLGVTFVYDEVEGAYVASQQAGAPQNGVRIVYYAMDPMLHRPSTPLTALGYVELEDLSTAASDRLGVTVVRTSGDAATELAKYWVDVAWTLTETALGATFSSEGFLSNGTDQLNFQLAQGLTLGQAGMSVTQDLAMDLEGRDVSVAFQAEVTGAQDSTDAATGTMDITATLRNEGQQVVIELQADQGVLDGNISHNDAIIAYIAGTLEEPVFTDAAGNTLDAAQMQALKDLFDSVGTLFELADGIFSPAQ